MKGSRLSVASSCLAASPPLTHGGPMLLKTDAGGNSEACCYCGLFLNQRLNSAPNTHTHTLGTKMKFVCRYTLTHPDNIR